MRLIDADALMPNAEYKGAYDFVSAYDIANAPTIDPVKHGRWIYYEDETIDDGGRCSICQCDQPVFWEDWTWKFVETAYCPNCGAKMDEVEE